MNCKTDSNEHENKIIEMVRVKTSCMDLQVSDTVISIAPGDHQMTKNMFEKQWDPEEFVDEDGNLTIGFRVVGRLGNQAIHR